MKRTGQYALIEQVLLFTIGISITLGFLIAFEDLTADVREDMGEAQTRLLSQYVAASAVELAESGSEGELVLSLPETVAGQDYVVRMGEDGVTVETTGERHTASLNGLTERFDVSGAIEGREGDISLVYQGGTIELGRQ